MATERRGFTLLEQLLVVVLFSVISLLLFLILHQGFARFRALNSRHDTQRQLNRAWSWLKRDLEKASPDQIGIKRISSSAGNGDVVWFLSAEDPSQTDQDRRFQRDPGSGRPVWQCHIIYYLIRPGDYGSVSQGGSAAVDPASRADYFAAHKFLLRKVVDRPGQEVLMSTSEIDGYTSAPPNHDLSSLMAEPGVRSCTLVAERMLSFEVSRTARLLEIDLFATHIAEAQKHLPLGTTSLRDSRFTQREKLSLALRN